MSVQEKGALWLCMHCSFGTQQKHAVGGPGQELISCLCYVVGVSWLAGELPSVIVFWVPVVASSLPFPLPHFQELAQEAPTYKSVQHLDILLPLSSEGEAVLLTACTFCIKHVSPF